MIKSHTTEIGNRIRLLRKEKKITQSLLAERIRKKPSTISKIESGEIKLTRFMSLAICNLFGVCEEWLLTGKEPRYDDREKLLEARAKELGDDIWHRLVTMKAAYNLRRQAIEGAFDERITVSSEDELSDPKFFKLLRQFDRIYEEGAKEKVAVLESILNALDPGEKKREGGP